MFLFSYSSVNCRKKNKNHEENKKNMNIFIANYRVNIAGCIVKKHGLNHQSNFQGKGNLDSHQMKGINAVYQKWINKHKTAVANGVGAFQMKNTRDLRGPYTAHTSRLPILIVFAFSIVFLVILVSYIKWRPPSLSELIPF